MNSQRRPSCELFLPSHDRDCEELEREKLGRCTLKEPQIVNTDIKLNRVGNGINKQDNVYNQLENNPPLADRNQRMSRQEALDGFVPYRIRKRQVSRFRELKGYIFTTLDGPGKSRNNWFNRAVPLLILSSLGIAVAVTIRGLDQRLEKRLKFILFVTECCLCGLFGLEYLLRLWSCGVHSTYGGFFGRIKYAIKPHMILDLIIMLSSGAFVTSLKWGLDEDYWRYIVLLQLMRVLCMDRQRGAFKTFRRVIKKHIKELMTCWYMGFIVVVFLSYMIYADPTADRERTVNDLASGLYWGIVSMTTIGYGDISPVTNLAKLILCVFALIGTGFIAMPAGIIGSGFALQVVEDRKRERVTMRRRPAAELVQASWRLWASDIKRGFQATWLPHMRVISRPTRESQITTINTIEKLQRFSGSLRDRMSLRAKEIPASAPDAPEEEVYRKLSIAEKLATGFIRRLKFNVAIKNFKKARRPYDEKDILDTFAAGQLEMFTKLKHLENRFDSLAEAQAQFSVREKKLHRKVDQIDREVSDMSKDLREAVTILRDLAWAKVKEQAAAKNY